MAKTVYHPANARGHNQISWLNAYHSFSFGNHYDPEKMHFGVLRVLNDDTVAPGKGFDAHPHDNMEIITIPLAGAIRHKDSMGNSALVKHGDVQVMSAGTGIFHSEFNANQDAPLKLLQIWLFPNQRNVTPRYGQITLDPADRYNKFQQILSPNPEDEGVWIHQDAWFHLVTMDKELELEYTLKKPGNGVYLFVISGDATAEGQPLYARDGLGISEVDSFKLHADSNAEVLVMEVPMQLPSLK